MSFFQTSILIALIALLVSPSPLFARDKSDKSSDGVVQLRLEIKKLELKDQLEGRIEKKAEENEKIARELISSLKHLGRATYDVFCEVQREDLVAVGEPDVIGPIIVPAIPSGSGLLGTGEYLPVRKKWIDHFMSQIESLYPMVTKELEAVKLSKDISKEGKEHYVKVVKAYNKLGPALKDLDKNTLGPKYDNMRIARCAALSRNYIETMIKETKRLHRSISRREKSARKDVRDLEKQIKKDERKVEKDTSGN